MKFNSTNAKLNTNKYETFIVKGVVIMVDGQTDWSQNMQTFHFL